MQRFPRLLVCLPLLATSACAADAIAGPGPADLAPVAQAEARSKIQAVNPQKEQASHGGHGGHRG
jgi:hypothetical protein